MVCLKDLTSQQITCNSDIIQRVSATSSVPRDSSKGAEHGITARATSDVGCSVENGLLLSQAQCKSMTLDPRVKLEVKCIAQYWIHRLRHQSD